MKTILLLSILLGTITLGAQETKYDLSTIEALKDKKEVIKDEVKSSVESRFSTKDYKKADWTRKIEDHDYERGKIRTH